jgi:hypothetical protein
MDGLARPFFCHFPFLAYTAALQGIFVVVMMKRYLLLASLVLPLGVSGSACADTLFKCQGPDGRMVYTNQKGSKSCEVISQDKPVSTFNAPKAKQATPGDFPRVNGDQQKTRDNDRRAILDQEMGNEQKNLDAAKKTLAEQENLTLPEERIAGGGIKGSAREERLKTYRDNVQLHERNIESIRREIGNLK